MPQSARSGIGDPEAALVFPGSGGVRVGLEGETHPSARGFPIRGGPIAPHGDALFEL